MRLSLVQKQSIGVAIAILMGLMAWDIWQTREELVQLRHTLKEQRYGAPVITAAPVDCPVNTVGNTTTAQDPPSPSKATLTFVPPVAQIARDSNQAVAPIVVLPGADFGEAIKLMQREQDRTQPKGSAGMSPFGPAQ